MLLVAILSVVGAVFLADAVPLKGCGGHPADIVFVVDESGSIWGPDFTDRQIPFVKAVVDDFDIGPNKTQVGMLTFSGEARLHFHLKAYTTASQVEAALDAVQQIRGGTKTYDAIKYMRDVSFARGNGARDGVKKIGIIITDGQSDTMSRTIQEAREAKQRGQILFAIGVGNITADRTRELEGIASTPSNQFVFEVTNFRALYSLKEQLVHRTCEVTTPSPPLTTPTAPPPPQIEGCHGRKPLDVVFALSDIAGPDETGIALDLVQKVSSGVQISPEKVQIGVTPRWCDAREINVNDNRDGNALSAALDTRRLTSLRPELHLKHMRTKSFEKCGGGRERAAKVGVLIVDGELKNPQVALREAAAAKAKGMHLVVIGVGKYAKQPRVADVLKDMASSHDQHTDYFHAEDYAGLLRMKDHIIKTLCDAARGSDADVLRLLSEFGGEDLPL